MTFCSFQHTPLLWFSTKIFPPFQYSVTFLGLWLWCSDSKLMYICLAIKGSSDKRYDFHNPYTVNDKRFECRYLSTTLITIKGNVYKSLHTQSSPNAGIAGNLMEKTLDALHIDLKQLILSLNKWLGGNIDYYWCAPNNKWHLFKYGKEEVFWWTLLHSISGGCKSNWHCQSVRSPGHTDRQSQGCPEEIAHGDIALQDRMQGLEVNKYKGE